MKIVLLGFVVLVLVFMWATYPWELKAKIEPGAFGSLPKTVDVLERPTTLTALTWNMAYAYGQGSEGTEEYSPLEKSQYELHLKMMGEAIKSSSADVVFLQEIDFGSSRSHYLDELSFLGEQSGLGHWARAESWRTQYVPFPYWPISRQFGKMLSGGAVLSKWPIKKNEVHLLSKPGSKAWWYNLFYLYRYFQVVTLDVLGTEIKVINLHLEAFDQLTKEEQAKEIVEFCKNEKIDFIAGDFNMLPDGAMKRSGFANSQDKYEGDKTYSIFKALPLQEVVEHSSYLQKEESWFTFPAMKPDRRLDYIYHAGRWPLIQAEVLTGAHAPASDHLPLKATFKFLEPVFIRD